jgi:Na+-driven multidrug efflux pump
MLRKIPRLTSGGTFQRDWTKGNLFRNLLMLSWPMTVTQTLMSLGAYLLSKYTDTGIIGIRWAMSASVVVGALANVIYFRTGKWKTRKV